MWSIHFSLKLKEAVANQVYFFFNEEIERQIKAVLPKLQEEFQSRKNISFGMHNDGTCIFFNFYSFKGLCLGIGLTQLTTALWAEKIKA